jgi:hypothetical protein
MFKKTKDVSKTQARACPNAKILTFFQFFCFVLFVCLLVTLLCAFVCSFVSLFVTLLCAFVFQLHGSLLLPSLRRKQNRQSGEREERKTVFS